MNSGSFRDNFPKREPKIEEKRLEENNNSDNSSDVPKKMGFFNAKKETH